MLHVTYCSKDKDRENKDIPAVKRYKSERIEKIKDLAEQRDEKFAILSGKYGLIEPEEVIPFYDEILREKDIPYLLPEVKNFLQSRNVEKVVYHTREIEGERRPYFKLIKNACDTLDIAFEKKIIED